MTRKFYADHKHAVHSVES